MNKRTRQKKILEIIGSKNVSTQQALARELARAGILATQSSVSRDIVELEIAKINGHYAAVDSALQATGPITAIDTAGDNLLVIKTYIGQAQPTALTIDGASFPEIVGTVAGDDTILVAVKNETAQRIARKRILKLFSRASRTARRQLIQPDRTIGKAL